MAESSLTQTRVRELFEYDATTGVVTRRITVGRRGPAGAVVGCLTAKGYLSVRIDGRFFLLHRVIFLYVHGRMPAAQIDHRNGIKTDNRLTNLREATEPENSQNVKAHRDSSSGLLGVSWRESSRKWRASIGINGTHKHLGYFDSKADAHRAYVEAKRELHRFQPTVR
jgi:hypothetical protein